MTLAKTTLYAPAAPFVAAIHEWVEQESRRRRCAYRTERSRGFGGAPPPIPIEETVLRKLGELARINRHLMEELSAGRREFIDLSRADRLALAMNVPLSLLAEEFKTLDEWALGAGCPA